jgi:hypothetical protein
MNNIGPERNRLPKIMPRKPTCRIHSTWAAVPSHVSGSSSCIVVIEMAPDSCAGCVTIVLISVVAKMNILYAAVAIVNSGDIFFVLSGRSAEGDVRHPIHTEGNFHKKMLSRPKVPRSTLRPCRRRALTFIFTRDFGARRGKYV